MPVFGVSTSSQPRRRWIISRGAGCMQETGGHQVRHTNNTCSSSSLPHTWDKYSPNCREELSSKIIDWDSSIENFRLTGSIPELEAFKIMMAKGYKLSPLLWDAERGNNFLTRFLPWLLFQTPLLLNLCLSLLQAVFFVSVFQLPCKKLGYARVAKTALSISAIVWKAWKKHTLFTKTGDCKFLFKQRSLSDLCGC